MKRRSNISLLLPILGLLICASASQAQVVTATAKVTLTVIPGPGVSFTPASQAKNPSSINQGNDGGITIHTSSNVAVTLNTSAHRKMLNDNNLSEGGTRTLTSKDLTGVSKVEVVYLGS
jgi:hypothetical protein